MRFGKHKGCEFCINNCNYINFDSNIFGNEFFISNFLSTGTSSSYPSCSSGRLSKTIYQTSLTPSLDPGEGYEEDPYKKNLRRIIGEYYIPNYQNVCPFAKFPNENYYGSCFYTKTSINKRRNEVIGSNSFCVLS